MHKLLSEVQSDVLIPSSPSNPEGPGSTRPRMRPYGRGIIYGLEVGTTVGLNESRDIRLKFTVVETYSSRPRIGCGQ